MAHKSITQVLANGTLGKNLFTYLDPLSTWAREILPERMVEIYFHRSFYHNEKIS